MTILRCALLLLSAALLSAGEAKPDGLNTRLSFEFQNTSLESVTTFLKEVTGLTIEIVPSVTQRGSTLSLMAKDMTARNTLVWATELTGTMWREEGGGILLSELGGKIIKPFPERVIAPGMQKLLDQLVTLDLAGQEAEDALGYLSHLYNLNIVASARLTAAKPKLTLAVTKASVSSTLDRIAKAIGATWVVRNEAVFLDLAEPAAGKR